MLQSMTGFGRAAGSAGSVEYDVEVRSVNNRYLKTSLRLPECWSAAEGDIDQLVRRHVSRGTVTLTVRMKVADARAASRINTDVLAAYLEQLRGVDVEGYPGLRIDVGSLMQLPGVCEPPNMTALLEETRAVLLKLITEAMEALRRARRQEGKAIEAELAGRCDEITAALKQIAGWAPRSVEAYRRRLTERMAELVSAAAVAADDAALAREVAIYAEKCDIAEEISRLGAHVRQFRGELKTKGSIGRKLDFIAQEMLREANTIASKAADEDIARTVVDVKTAIDRIKEQVQNVE